MQKHLACEQSDVFGGFQSSLEKTLLQYTFLSQNPDTFSVCLCPESSQSSMFKYHSASEFSSHIKDKT